MSCIRPEDREAIILDHIRQHGSTVMRLTDRAAMTDIPESTFMRDVNTMTVKGMIRSQRAMHGGRLYIVEVANDQPEPQRADRVRCPRCETVNCERHSASHLTTGRISPVYR